MNEELRQLVISGQVEQVKPGSLDEGDDVYRQSDGRRSTVIKKIKVKDWAGTTMYRLYYDQPQPGTPWSTVYPHAVVYRFVQQDTAPVQQGGEFTVRDGVAWLGLSWKDYERANEILKGRHGGPFVRALLEARDAQGTEITPAEVLARNGIDPTDPLAAARRYDRGRSALDDQET